MGQGKETNRVLPARGKIRQAIPSEWEKERGTPRHPKWRKTPGRGCQGVGGGVKLPRGTDNTGVEEFPWGDKTSEGTL